MVKATNAALDPIELDPGIDLPELRKRLGISGLRTGQVTTFALLWLVFERSDDLDPVRFLGER